MRHRLTAWYSQRRARLIALAFLALALPPSATAQPVPVTSPQGAYQVDQSWPAHLPNQWLIGDVGGVSVDRHNHIWIVHRPTSLTAADVQAGTNPPTAKCCAAAPPVLEFDTSGTLLRSWGGKDIPDWFTSEHSIFADANDHIWVLGAGARDGQLLKFTMDGKLLLRIGRKAEFAAADDPTILGMPTDVYVDTGAREVYVADGYRNHRVIVFDSESGAYKRQWTAYGRKVDPAWASPPDAIGSRGDRDPNLFTTVHCVTMIGGEVFVCDRTNSRIQIFKPDGTYIREIFYNRGLAGAAGSTWDAAPVPGRPNLILALDGVNSEFALLDTKTGAVSASYQSKGRYAGQMHWPHQVAIDREGRLYIAEVGGASRIQRFVPGAR